MLFNIKKPIMLALFTFSAFSTNNTHAMHPSVTNQMYGGSPSIPKSVTVQNPCYVYPYTPTKFEVRNGDTLLFADSSVIGDAIRGAQAINETDNPNGITHSEIVVLDYANAMLETVKSINFNTKDEGILRVSQKSQQQAIEHIQSNCADILAMPRNCTLTPFCFGATGSASEVLKGIWPHVHITCLDAQLREYNGNIYIRNLLEKHYIPQEITRNYIADNLFKTYETFTTFPSLLKAVKSNNKEHPENSDRLFCSELVADFYKHAGIFPSSVVACNVIPEDLSSGAMEYDMLSSIANKDLMLKCSEQLSQSTIDGDTCIGQIAKFLANLFNCTLCSK